MKIEKKFTEIDESFWIDANAGSGKTTLIIKRLISLLISGEDYKKIVAITYTNVAADEMKERLIKKLSELSNMRFELLKEYIVEELGLIFYAEKEDFYRSIKDFVNIDELKITTIHRFCIDVINRKKYFFKIDEDYKIADTILIDFIQKKTRTESIKNLENSIFDKMTMNFIDSSIYEEINNFTLNNLSKFRNIDFENFHHKINNFLELKFRSYQEVFEKYSHTINKENFAIIANIKSEVDSNDSKKIGRIFNLKKISFSIENFFRIICPTFLKGDFTKYSKFLTKKTIEENATYLINTLDLVIESAYNAMIDFNKLLLKNVSLFAFENLKKILKKEKQLKKKFITYDDILEIFEEGLKNEENISLLYDLSFEINHLIIDESQDTNPISWKIICSIINECLFENSEISSCFIVGDPKQSIYSFQGASYTANLYFKSLISKILENKGRRMNNGYLNQNYRSGRKILEYVDKFIDEKMSTFGVKTKHFVKSENEGFVNVLEIFSDSNQNKEEYNWLSDILSEKNNEYIQKVIEIIKELLNNGEKPSDIMILFESRSYKNNTPYELIQSLKRDNIAVNEIDRFKLNNHIIFQDVLSLMKFIQNPYVDSNMLCILKSPIFGLNLQEIYNINKEKRDLTLLSFLKENNHILYEKFVYFINVYGRSSFFEVLKIVFFDKEISSRYVQEYGFVYYKIIDSVIELVEKIKEIYNFSDITSIYNAIKSTSIDIENEIDKNKIQVRTVHSAKGLEQKNVIFFSNFKTYKYPLIMNYEEEEIFIPYISSVKNLEQIEKIKENSKLLDEFEQLRLHYVAFTRAKSRLIVVGIL